MNIQEYVNNIFNKNVKLEKTNLGLTNQIYIAYVDENKYAIRVPMEDSEKIINNEHETSALELIKNIDLDVCTIHYNPNLRIKITKWVNCSVFDKYCDSDKLQKVAKLMHRLHDLNLKSPYDFNAWDLLDKYHFQIKQQLFPINKYLILKELVKKLTDNCILCHNDFVNGNILLSKEHDYLIDFEFAANNDPIFDVTSFITENNLNDTDRKIFINEYFKNNITPNLMYKIIVFEAFHNLLWLEWANMMYESRKNKVYFEIAKIKYEALLKKWKELKNKAYIYY